MRVAAGIAAGLTCLAVSIGARGDVADPDASRIAAAGHSLEWTWTPPGHAERYGHAETLVHGSLAAVKANVTDYARYREILPTKFRKSHVIHHLPDGAQDVYMQIAVMHDMILLWDVSRFTTVQADVPGTEIIEGKMLPGRKNGNVDASDVVWTLHAIDPEWTVLKLDLMLSPGIPAPQGAVDAELRDSARYAVDAIHDWTQGNGTVGPGPS
jgi:hypothetical protein